MEIRQLWPVNILVDNLNKIISENDREKLKITCKKYIDQNPYLPEIMAPDQPMYNLIPDPCPVVQTLRQEIFKRMKILLKIEQHLDPENVPIETFMFARSFNKFERAKPHCHRGVDYVAVYYIDMDITDDNSVTYQEETGGRLLLIDPISQRSRSLNHLMIHQISPVPGDLIIHPAYLFHESEIYKGNNERILIAANMRLYEKIQEPNLLPL